MNILVIGGAGYIGSHAVSQLDGSRGFQPVVLDNFTLGHKKAIPVGVPVVKGSYGNYALVRRTLKKYSIDAVMHFAARSLVAESARHPELYWNANVIDGLELLRAMKDQKVKRIIFSSTASVYGEPDRNPITEDHPIRPISPYGSSKAAFELVLQDFVRVFGFSAVSLRYFNVVGADAEAGRGEDHHPETHMIPNLLRHASGLTSSFHLFGDDYPTRDGTCIRDYVDIQDLIAAHLLALRKCLKSGTTWSTYNVGSGLGYSNQEVIELVKKVTKKPLVVEVDSRRVGDPAKLVSSPALIQKELGWKARHSLEDSIRSAWFWHSSHPGGYATII